MKRIKKETVISFGFGFLTGAVNALLGSGGGMIAVPALKKCGISDKQSHSNAVAVILPLSVISAAIYIFKDYVKPSDAFVYIVPGLIGALIGTKILEKIKPRILKGIFGGFMVYAGIRLLFK